MNGMIIGLYGIFCLILKVLGLYLGVISVFFVFKPKGFPKTNRLLRFAVLVPARNEEGCIAGIVGSIKKQNYPPELVDIYVIPNNCTDGTAHAAVESGAAIIPVSSEVRSKGSALHEAFERLLKTERYDAYCVFDADNEVDPDFIAEMNKALSSGYRAAKSRILAKNAHESLTCACYEIYFCNANQFTNTARQNLGLSARLIGTGFGVRRDLMEELGGWNTDTLTEDAEFYALLAVRGEKIAYCSRAVTYDEEPITFYESLIQRRRWMSGVIEVGRLKIGSLIAAMGRRKSFFTALDAGMQFSLSILQAFAIPIFLLYALCEPAAALTCLLGVASGFFGSVLLTGGAALILQRRLTAKTAAALVFYPVFMFSNILLHTYALFCPNKVWKPIRHTGVRLGEP